jgi:hypothetical protein
MRRRARWALSLLALMAMPAAAQERPPPATVALREEDVLLYEVTLDKLTLTDALQAYASAEGGPLLPVGELVRLLDLNVTVSPREKRVTGRIGAAQRPLIVDIDSGTARLDGKPIELKPGDAVAGLTDIFMRASLVEALLPLKISVDDESLIIMLTATEQLPIQARLDRLGRLRSLRPDLEIKEEVLRVDSPWRALSVPAFDVAGELGADATAPRFRRRYDIRMGADALYSNFQGYLGSDERGRPSTARLLLERRDREGDMLGPLGLTRLSAGDVFTPSLAIGARSIGGRGIALSSAPLEQTSVFDRVDLRGELPLGFDVELYVNDVLRGGQQTPVQGRFEFLDVPLVRGVNVIRIVTYGPRGERSEETRVINVGGGALAKGETNFEFGAVQQERPLLDLNGDGIIAGPGVGDLRVTAGIAHGLTEGLTLVGGVALFTPGFAEKRKLASAGLRTSLLGYAVQLDGAYDDTGGYGAALGLAGRTFGVSTVARHSEYGGGFLDETLPSGGGGRPLRRHSELTLDFNVGPLAGLTFPFSLRAQRDEFVGGGSSLLGAARLSTSAGNILLSTGLDYDRTTLADGEANERLTGVLAASTFAGFDWQVRGTLDYDLLPEPDLRSIAVTVDRDLSERLALRFGLGRSFAGMKDSTFQAGAIFRLPFADVSLAGDYTAPRNDWRVGLQIAFGLTFDPFAGGYRMTRPGPAAGGNAAILAFLDRNADDRFDAEIDEPVSGVLIDSGAEKATTDADGRALITGLGYGIAARMQMNLDGVDNPYIASPPQVVEFMPRAGDVARVLYPLRPVGEVLARVQFRDAAGKLTGVSAVKLLAVRDGAAPVEATTEFDGTAVFERLPAGSYELKLDPTQAARLGMRLIEPIRFAIAPDGGFVPDVVATVAFAAADGEKATSR